jgi:hypothetical protein
MLFFIARSRKIGSEMLLTLKINLIGTCLPFSLQAVTLPLTATCPADELKALANQLAAAPRFSHQT